MKRTKVLTIVISLFLVLMAFSACSGSNEITLHLSYGDRTGTYTGDLNEGVPDGQGKFVTKNDEGDTWTYEGSFVNGHFEGEGQTTWASGSKEIGTYKNDVIVPISDDSEINKAYTDSKPYKDHFIEITGKVFGAPEYDDDGIGFQMFRDIENSEQNTIVYLYDPDFKLKDGDFVRVVGKVNDPFTGENALGGTITAMSLTATEAEIIPYSEAAAPSLKTIELSDMLQDQLGYKVSISKVEFADNETRIYVTVNNAGTANFNLYDFNAKIVQNGKQYEYQPNYSAGYPELQTDLVPGVTSEGIIVFPKIEQSDFQLILSASSDAYSQKINPYTFNFSVN